MFWWTLRKFESQDPVVRQTGVEMLRQSPDKRAPEILLRALRDEAHMVRESAAEALISRREVSRLLIELGDHACIAHEAIVQVFARHADEIKVDLLRTAADTESALRPAAANILEKIDPRWQASTSAIEYAREVASGLRDGDTRVRVHAAKKLGQIQIKDTRVVRALVERLADPDGSVQSAASEALENIDPGWPKSEAVVQSMAFFESSIDGSDDLSRAAAFDVLLRIGSAEALNIVGRALGGKREIPHRLLAMLGKNGGREAVAALIEFLKNRNQKYYLRRDAAKVLESSAPPSMLDSSTLALVAIWASILTTNEGWVQVAAMGSEGVTILKDLLQEEEPEIRSFASRFLGKTGDPAAMVALIDLLRDVASDRVVSLSPDSGVTIICINGELTYRTAGWYRPYRWQPRCCGARPAL